MNRILALAVALWVGLESISFAGEGDGFFCGENFLTTARMDSYDVFIPIAKYIRQGDAERLSAWFADNLEITIFSKTSDSSRSQAKQIIKSFFNHYTPRSFEITHTAERSNMKYALGILSTGGDNFTVTIFVSLKGNDYRIQQLHIEKVD